MFFKFGNHVYGRIFVGLGHLFLHRIIHSKFFLRKKNLFRAASGCQGRYAHAFCICACFYCISLKNRIDWGDKLRGKGMRNNCGGISVLAYRKLIHFGVYNKDESKMSSLKYYIPYNTPPFSLHFTYCFS